MPQLCDREHCTGCTACMAVCPKQCIRMEADPEGFLYPVIDAGSCVECRACEAACPVLHKPPVSKEPTAYAARNKQESVRQVSTSGGVFTLLAEKVLADGGLVFGAAYDENYRVVHQAVDTPDGLQKLRGAKYSQSYQADCFAVVKKALEQGRSVLYSGTPCQTAGLRAALGRDYEKLLLVDLICHGVPAPAVWEAYLAQKSRNHGNVLPNMVNQRSKETGWSTYSVEMRWPDGERMLERNDRDPFIRAFVGDLCLRPSCHTCSFKGLGRCTDFTLGDYWGVWDQVPAMSDNRGTSIVLLHTEKAQMLWQQIQDSMTSVQVDTDRCMQQNPAAVRAAAVNIEKRRAFMDRFRQEEIGDLVRELLPQPGPVARMVRKFGRLAKKILRKLR